jgi:hypothetical protein
LKLGFICANNANAYYRAIFPMRAMQKRGHTVLWPEGNEDLPLSRLASCDLVHCYRRMERLADLQTLAKYGVAISFDNDDNHAATEFSPGGKRLEERRQYKKIDRSTIAVARFADLVTTTSEPLAAHYRAAGVERVAVVGNYLERAAFNVAPRRKHERVVLGWVAEKEHRVDLERLPIAAALRELLGTCPNLQVVSVGLRLPIDSDRYRHIANVPFLDLLKFTATLDIGIAPIVDSPFNRSRSNVKLKEYSAGGAAWLASPVGPYLSLGEDQGGMLVGDGEWVVKASELICEGRKRKRLMKRAERWSKEQEIARHAHLWENAFLEAIERDPGSRVVRGGMSHAR